MKGATVATTSSRALLAACRELGLDVDAVLAAAGVTAAQVNDPDGRLPGEAVAVLWQTALAQSKDPAIGLRAANAVPFGAYRVIDFLAASAPTVGEGLSRVARYFPLINSGVELRIHDDGAEVGVELASTRDPAGLPRPYAEYALAVTFLHCRHAHGFDWPLARVTFAFPAPPSSELHARTFDCPVAFGRPRNEMVIARTTWELPSRNASTDLLRTLEDHADRLLAGLRAAEVSSGVTRILMEELRGGEPTLERVARRMGMSARTLQRRLQLERSSFAEVLDRTRRHFADCYVRERTLSLTEVAYLLGFSEQSAFTRAFQRWYGVSPSRYRDAKRVA
jgi:AraC-like DNA-binding protein